MKEKYAKLLKNSNYIKFLSANLVNRFGDSVDALKDGKIDAAFIVAGAPTTAVTSLSTSNEVRLVSLDKEHVDALIKESPYYSAYTINKEVYGTSEDVSTVAVGAVVIAQDEVSENDIYNFLTGVYNHLDEIKAAHAKGNELDLKFAASYEAVPYHKGAVKFFKEKGITVKGK